MMSVAETDAEQTAARSVIHPLYVRITHWINAVAMLIMIGSGWEIYNASPLFGFTFPRSITLGGWLAGALLWHFAAMWLLILNGLVYVTLGLATGRFRRKLLPIRARRGRARPARGADRAAQPRRSRGLQRRAEGALCRGAACRRRDRRVGLCPVEAGAAAGSWRRCSAATRARGSCISSPWRRSSRSWSSTSSWRCWCPAACAP